MIKLILQISFCTLQHAKSNPCNVNDIENMPEKNKKPTVETESSKT